MPKKKSLVNISVVAVGGRGCNVLQRLDKMDAFGVKRVAVCHAGQCEFNKLELPNKIELRFVPRYSSERTEEGLAKQLVEEQSEKIQSALQGSDVIFFIGNLFNLSIAEQISAIKNLSAGAITLYVGALPFAFEGKENRENAERVKSLLEERLDGVLAIESDKFLSQEHSAFDAFTSVDQALAEMIGSLVDIVSRCGIVNVDFADFRTTVRGVGELFFKTTSVSRKDLEGVGKVLFTEQHAGRKLNRVLYIIYASMDIAMEEVCTIGTKIKENIADNARIIFGLVQDKNQKEEIRVVVVGG
ncbi:MAG: hypothetical protein WC269_03390 [Candidatus Gracilibacteria bacterium]|jgi:cell division protein FtsZ